ncbi:hypothetical protein [Sphingomonas sp.]
MSTPDRPVRSKVFDIRRATPSSRFRSTASSALFNGGMTNF